jgi:hypothetical protein
MERRSVERQESEEDKKEESKQSIPQPIVGEQPRKGIYDDVTRRKPPGSEFRPMKRGGCGLRR